jgi:predicted HicB family RNase H-like nuclease
VDTSPDWGNVANDGPRTHSAVDEDNEDSKTVEQILQKCEGAAREARKRYSGLISVIVAVLMAAAAVYWVLS